MQLAKPLVRNVGDLGAMEFVQAEYRDHRFPLHFHDTFVIQLVHKGVDWCSGNDASACSGQVFVHLPGAPHTGGTLDNDPLCYRAIYPGRELFRELTCRKVDEFSGARTWIVDHPAIVRRVDDFLDLCANVSEQHSVPESSLKELFEAVFDAREANEFDADSEEGDSPTYQRMLRARAYLTEHFARDVTNEELSVECGVSQFHLIRCFRDHFGITPRQFLVSFRVSHAKRLLAEGYGIAEIAIECGFSDQSHLCRYFKKISGYSPGKLRR